VLGTARTIASGAYARAVSSISTRFEVVGQAAPLLVPLVEEGWIEGDVPRLAVERYLAPLVSAKVSVIVLGCTHYPVLKNVIVDASARAAGTSIAVIDSAEATANAVVHLLAERRLQSSGASEKSSLELLVTDLPGTFSAMAERCLGGFVPEVSEIDL
jgi:glutamate racemase